MAVRRFYEFGNPFKPKKKTGEKMKINMLKHQNLFWEA